jgi:hypothetical protein
MSGRNCPGVVVLCTTAIGTVIITDNNNITVVKLQRANGGYLGTQRRRRTWRPTKRSGELEASNEPEMSEWGNP